MTVTGSNNDAGAELSRPCAGLLISDPIHRQLFESIVISLDLEPRIMQETDLRLAQLIECEMIIADEQQARATGKLLWASLAVLEEVKPALIALVSSSHTSPWDHRNSGDFNAVLMLSEQPSLLSAQVRIALHAHRVLAHRYRSALAELNLDRSILRSVTTGITVANAQLPDMPLMYVNPAFESMTGYTLEEVTGKNCRFLQHHDQNQPGLELIREALQQQRESVAIIKNYRKDGSPFWNQLALSPIVNREGVTTHFVGIQMDVTERVDFEAALRESEKLAAVGRLASAIAHEINNPLEAVTNLVYLALLSSKHEQHEESRHYLKLADMELQRVQLITTQSLRFYKQSHGPEAVTCEGLIASILDIYQSRFTNCAVEMQQRYRSGQRIVCLASEIRQVLSNLVANATDAMKQTGGTLRVRTREATNWRTAQKGVMITVADTGRGMSRKTQADIYKAFFTTKGAQGTGLGLWVSCEIVQRHDGCLKVRSSQGHTHHGTVFQLFLPFHAAIGEVDSLHDWSDWKAS